MATWCFTNRTPPPEFTREPSLKAGSMKRNWLTTTRNRRARLVVLSSSLAHAGILAISDRIHGHRSDHAIYQARFMRYLDHRGLKDTAGRHVWGVFGDGEMDEPESIGALTLAAREHLDNLTFIINCNLQRLDGPVRGNGQIIQELESLFTGAGWNVIKVLWGSEWDALFARDTHHVLLRRFAETVDGQYQNLGAKDGDYNRAKFFQLDPQSSALVEHLSDAEINALKRGGHDFRKLYAAFSAARAHKGRPTVILAKTKKGYGMGDAGESRMTSHQAKKLDIEAIRQFRDRFNLPLSDEAVSNLQFYKPADNSAEMAYVRSRRKALGGFMPSRRRRADPTAVPPIDSYARFALQADGKEMSTTMAAVRMLGALLRDSTLVRGSFRSWRMKQERLGWPACSARSAFTPRWASSTSRRI